MIRKILLFGSTIGMIFGLSGCLNGESAISYNDKLVTFQETCYKADDRMMEARDKENYGETKELYPKVLELCQQSLSGIEAMSGYDGDSTMKDAFLAEMEIEIAYLNKIGEALTYREIDELTEEEITAEENLWKEIDILAQKWEESSTHSETVQKTFAQQHGYELEN